MILLIKGNFFRDLAITLLTAPGFITQLFLYIFQKNQPKMLAS